MKGYRFFLEYDNKTEKNKGTRKNPGKHTGNVLALYCTSYGRSFYYETHVDKAMREEIYEGLGAIGYKPNGHVGHVSPCYGYIRDNCKRISEALARTIHPALFMHLDSVQ